MLGGQVDGTAGHIVVQQAVGVQHRGLCGQCDVVFLAAHQVDTHVSCGFDQINRGQRQCIDCAQHAAVRGIDVERIAGIADFTRFRLQVNTDGFNVRC